jgi:hypothetical protein
MAKVNRSDLGAALKTGDHLAGLEALRDQIATDIDACGSAAFRDKAVLYYRLIGVLLEIEALRPTVPAPVVHRSRRSYENCCVRASSNHVKKLWYSEKHCDARAARGEASASASSASSRAAEAKAAMAGAAARREASPTP